MIVAGKKIHETLVDALKACRRHLVYAAIFSFFVNILYLTQTIYMLQVYNRVMPTNGTMTLVYLSLMAMFAYLTLAMLDNLRGRLLLRSSVRLDVLLAQTIMRHVIALPRQALIGFRYQNAMRDFDTFKAASSGMGVSAIFDSPWVIIYALLCTMLHPWLGALCLVGIVLMALLTWLQERATVNRLMAASQLMGRAHMAQDLIMQRSDTVRALGMVDAMVSSQTARRRAGIEDNVAAGMYSNRYRTAGKFLRLVMQSAGLGFGTLLAIDHKISPGAVFAASLLISRAMTPIDQILSSWKGLVGGYNAFMQLNELFTIAEVTRPVTNLPAPDGTIQVENLSVINHLQRSYVLNQVSFTVNPGEVVGVIGPSGAGKTTLARILAGADSYEVGHVRFDGADRREWDSQKLAKHVGYVPQDVALFEGSIRDNISRFESIMDGADLEDIDAAVVQAARDADIHDFILRLPNGYNTTLGPNGSGLSAGQSQLIALGRALYRRPKILILDEPNSNMDQAGEALLVRALTLFRSLGSSVVVVAHRAGILGVVDKILILQSGRVQFYGPRDEAAQVRVASIGGDNVEEKESEPGVVKGRIRPLSN